MLCYTALVVAVCALGSRLLLGLFTRDQEAILYGALLLSRECWSYPLTNLRHLQEARLRGEQRMGRYLTSNMAVIAMNMAGCLLLVPRLGFPGFYWADCVARPFLDGDMLNCSSRVHAGRKPSGRTHVSGREARALETH